jgi:hypothetical protein
MVLYAFVLGYLLGGLDGTHYGNYKYGDKLKVDDGINGSTGKFFPMGVQMNLKMARVNFHRR